MSLNLLTQSSAPILPYSDSSQDSPRAFLTLLQVFGSYWPALQVGFVWDDDDAMLTQNAVIKSGQG
jgi:hypothetical protein